MYDLDASFSDNGNSLYISNGYGRVRFYDLRAAQRRPITDHIIQLEKRTRALGSIVAQQNGSYVFAGNHEGAIFTMDRRNDLKEIRRIGKNLGCCKDLVLSSNDSILASGISQI